MITENEEEKGAELHLDKSYELILSTMAPLCPLPPENQLVRIKEKILNELKGDKDMNLKATIKFVREKLEFYGYSY